MTVLPRPSQGTSPVIGQGGHVTPVGSTDVPCEVGRHLYTDCRSFSRGSVAASHKCGSVQADDSNAG